MFLKVPNCWKWHFLIHSVTHTLKETHMNDQTQLDDVIYVPYGKGPWHDKCICWYLFLKLYCLLCELRTYMLLESFQCVCAAFHWYCSYVSTGIWKLWILHSYFHVVLNKWKVYLLINLYIFFKKYWSQKNNV